MYQVFILFYFPADLRCFVDSVSIEPIFFLSFSFFPRASSLFDVDRRALFHAFNTSAVR